MRVLMLGWEYPPFISGGLGTACRGLTEAMKHLQTRILFVLPRAIESPVQAESDEDVGPRERHEGDEPSSRRLAAVDHGGARGEQVG